MRDDEAFERYVAVHGVRLVQVAYLLTGNRDLAEDLVQTVLARAMLAWSRVGRMDDVDAYLRRALVNARTSWWRKSRREIPVGVVDDPGDASPPSTVALLLELDGAILRLPYRQRAAIVLRYYEDLDDRQIAFILDCAEATVRSLVHRGLTALRANPSTLSGSSPVEQQVEET